MPRAGLSPAAVVAAGAELTDDIGFTHLTMGLLAQRLGVRTPSLYKHISSQGELNRRIAALAIDEAADAVGAAIQGRAGREALAAAMHALREYVAAHPGRYAATLSVVPDGPDDPVTRAGDRLMDTLRAVLHAYPVGPHDTVHALRTLRSAMHGFAAIEAAGGFRWATDVDHSYDYLVDLLDRGLRTSTTAQHSPHRLQETRHAVSHPRSDRHQGQPLRPGDVDDGDEHR